MCVIICIILLWAYCKAALLYRRGGASYFCLLCCQTWQWNSVRCVCVCACVRALVRLYVAVAGVVKPAFEGVSRVLRDQAVRRGWAYATLRRTACAFNPRATRSASVSAADDAILFLHPNRTRARTYDRRWQTHDDDDDEGKNKKIKLYVLFRPPPSHARMCVSI